MQEAELEALEGLLYQMEVAAEAARLMLTTLGANFRVFSIWLLRLADASQACGPDPSWHCMGQLQHLHRHIGV